jgi:hypothetical protein
MQCLLDSARMYHVWQKCKGDERLKGSFVEPWYVTIHPTHPFIRVLASTEKMIMIAQLSCIT